MKITDVHTNVVPFSTGTWLDESRLSTPMAGIARFAGNRSLWRGPGADLCWVLIETDSAGVFGIGQTRGGSVAAALIRDHLRALIIGQDPLDVRSRLEEMQIAVMPYAAGGVGSMGTGAVELALWDLSARAAGFPLARLLGGAPKQLSYYLTCPDPAAVAQLDPAQLQDAAFVKVPARWGPRDPEGVSRTLADLRAVRAHVPDHVGIAVDCWMSWDRAFTERVRDRGEDVGLAWIEEPLQPDDLAGYAALNRSVSAVQIAGGEHCYGLRQGAQFLDAGGVGVFQPDVTWCGGIHVASVLGSLAALRGIKFAPHAGGSQPWARHLLAAQGPDALAEVLVGVGSRSIAEQIVVDDTPGVGVDPADAGF